MPNLLPIEITNRDGYKLFCDEISQAIERLKATKKGTFAYKDCLAHYRELRKEKSDYIKFQKEALERKQRL